MKCSKTQKIVFGFFGVVLALMLCSPFLVSYGSLSAYNPSEVKISVIMPVYNTEKYLDESLKSLECQTLKDIEIICINDGSTDKSLEILENHKKNDDRIKIINQKNRGVGAARNQGINVACGDYVIFCDSDDLVPSYAYEKAYEDAVKYDVDLVALGHISFDDGKELNLGEFAYDGSKVKHCGRKQSENPFEGMTDGSDYIWDKLFKRSFILENKLVFKEGIAEYEDGLFNFLTLPQINEMVKDDNVFYCCRKKAQSVEDETEICKFIESGLAVSKEIIAHHYLFVFRRGDTWIMNKIMDICYNRITTELKSKERQKFYATKLLNLIGRDYLSVYNIELAPWMINNLKELQTLAQS